MIESCKLLGDMLLSSSSTDDFTVLQNMVQSVVLKGKKDKAKQFMNLVFDLKENKIHLKLRDINENDVNKYVFVGNTSAPKAPLWRFTNSNRNYLLEIGSMLTTYLSMCESLGYDNYNKEEIENVLSEFFNKKDIYAGEVSESSKIASMYVLDIPKINGYEDFEDFEDIYITASNNKIKDWKDDYSKTVIKSVLEKRDLKSEDIALNTVSIIKDTGEEVFLSLTETYLNVLLKELTKANGAIDKKLNCCMCGKSGCLKDISFKYSLFQITKINWAYNMSKSDYSKRLPLCKDCYKSISIGEVVMGEKYSVRIGGNDIFLAPRFIEDVEDASDFMEDSLTIFRKVAATQNQFNAESFENIAQLFTSADTFELQNNFFVDMYFYEESNSATKIKKSQYQVDANYFIKVVSVMKENDKLFRFPFKNLNSIYYLYERSTSEGDKKVAATLCRRDLSAIMGKVPLKRANILRYAYPVIRMKYYADKSDGKYDYLNSVHLVNFYLNRLEELDLLQKSDIDLINMEDINHLPEELSNYIIDNRLTKLEAGLFLLGTIVSDIANAQKKSSGNRAILESVNMRGMNYNEVCKLMGKVSLKMRELSSKNELKYISGSSEMLKYQAACELITFANKDGRFNKYTKEEILNCFNLGYLYAVKQKIMYAKQHNESEVKNEVE